MQRWSIQKLMASLRVVFQSRFLWKIYGALGLAVLSALLTMVVVFLARAAVLPRGDFFDLASSVLIAMASGIFVAFLFGYYLVGDWHQSLAEITLVAERLTTGDFRARVKNLRNDEIGLLGLTLNLLGEELFDRMATLSQERTQLAALFAGTVEGIVAVGDDDRIIFANGTADRILKASVSLAQGKSIGDVPGVGVLLPVVLQCRSEKKRQHTELTLGESDNLLILETRASPFKGEQIAGVVVVFHDVTELRRLERVRRDFVSNVSHELKTPLTSIKGYVETLQSGAKTDPLLLDRFLSRIDFNVNRLVELVQDVLSLARSENGDHAWQQSNVDPSEAIRLALVQHEHALSTKKIELTVSTTPGVLVRANAESLRQIVNNLISNAINYTPIGGVIKVSIEIDGNYVFLKVSDNGIGIPVEHQPRIFERFYRVDKHRSREDGGTGLGLSIVKHLVHAMNGKVNVLSEPGVGSTFTIQMHRHHTTNHNQYTV